MPIIFFLNLESYMWKFRKCNQEGVEKRLCFY